jgi:hypothetical protein
VHSSVAAVALANHVAGAFPDQELPDADSRRA